jgi:thiamine biosynthesis lipoprotein
MEQREVRFRAMGTDCHIALLDGTEADLEHAVHAVQRLDGLWSRFRPDSELSRLNRADGEAMPVSADTMTLALRAARAFRLTGGWCDPFLGREIVALGYDRDFADLLAPADPTTTVHLSAEGHARRVRPSGTVEVDRHARTLRLPRGFDLDSGGIGKGLAADLVSRMLLDRGVAGALVNLGGDLRCRGRSPEGGWRIGLEHPIDRTRGIVERIRLVEGALATSTPLRRRWRDPAGRTHTHLLDPATGASIGTSVASVTVVAAAGWLAEALAKALIVGGHEVGRPLLTAHGATAIVVGLDGSVDWVR